MSPLRLHLDPSYDSPPLKDRILEIFSGNLKGVTKVESSDYARVFRFQVSYKGETKVFFYKEFLFRNIRDRLSVLFRKSRAVRGRNGSEILLNHDIATAIPVCVGEEKVAGVVSRNFMVTEAIPDSLRFESYLEKHFQAVGVPQKIRDKRKFIALLGKTIGRMHRQGIFQGDLRAGNILAHGGDPPKIYLIDNERTRFYRKLPDRKRIKNLVQINMTITPAITRADRVRFFLAYLEENPGLLAVKKTWMQRVLKKTRKRLFLKGWIAP